MEDPEWITKVTITDEMLTLEDLEAVRRLEVPYEGDDEDKGVGGDD
jgi:hypothetical protein